MVATEVGNYLCRLLAPGDDYIHAGHFTSLTLSLLGLLPHSVTLC